MSTSLRCMRVGLTKRYSNSVYMVEEWKSISHKTDYFISSFGRVRSLKRGQDRILNQYGHYKGYKIVFFWCKELKRTRKYFIHRLVAEAYLENPENKPYVNHIDCDKQNNSLVNLEWMTEQENSQWYQKNKSPAPSDGHEF